MSLVLLLLLLIASSVSSREIIITDQYQLEDFLCNGTNQLVEDTVVVLTTNITHFIRDVSFCVISTAYSLTITTNSSEKANVSCSNATIRLPTSGFAFTNVFKLTLHNLVFTYCGGYMRDFDAIKSINSTIYFTQHHSAVFVFLKINTLIIEEVRMVLYHGFAMVVVNPIQAAMNGMVLFKGEFNSDLVSYGSGILMLFVDSSDVRRRYVSVNRSDFWLNREYIDSIACLSDLQSVVQPFRVINSASLTVLFTQRNFTANVDIANSNFYDNFGSFAAAVLILHYNSMTFSTVSITHTAFLRNYNKKQCLGSDLSFVIKLDKTTNTSLYGHNGVHSLLSVSNSNFTNHVSGSHGKGKGGIIYMLLASYPMSGTIRITFKDVLFKDMYSSRPGFCMYVARYFSVSDSKTISSKHVEVILESVTVMNNIQYSTFEQFSRNGLFMIRDIARLVLNGSSNFTGNVGSVFDIADTSIILAGTLNFEDNNGSTGTVFNVIGSGRFFLQNGLRAQFIRNNAIHSGGAIYAYDELFDNCMFILANHTSPNVSILFINNTARDCGRSVFSSKIYGCFSNGHYYSASSARKLFRNISNGTLDGPELLCTLPLHICHCHSDTCVEWDSAIAVYPGMALQLSLAAVDHFNSTTYTEVSVNIATLDKRNISRPVMFWRVSNDRQVLRQGKCTLINVTFFKNDESLNPTKAFLAVTATSKITSHFKLSIYLRDCPVGFDFNPSTGKCNCSSVLYKIQIVPQKCVIFSKGPNITATITYSFVGIPVGWIGMIILNGTYVFEMSSACFCCNYDRKYDTFIVNVTDNTVFIGESKDLHAIKSFCPRNRGGVMCSNCTPGYSVVFSSLDCVKCSNWWLLTIVAYGLAGPLLIYLIYALKLTLTTGLINGIIFYAQIVCISEQTKLGSSLHNLTFYYYTITKGLISLLSFNINFNIPLCFYDGMTELWKSFVSFLFPVYLLAIVIGLIIISRYSVRLSNRIADSSVQVLVTVVHLSFATLLTSTLDVFTPVYIYTNTSDIPLKVWQKDGAVVYGKGGHLVLMIVTGVVVGPILITYLTVLLAGRPLMKINKVREYLRPIYEAIHAPYKHNKEFFSSITIILVIFLYLMNDAFVAKDPTKGLLLSVPFIMVYFILVIFYHPFKDVHLNILNAFLVSITSVVVSSVWYYFVSTITFAIIIASCDTVVIMTLVVIVLHNIPALRKLAKRVKLKVTSFLSSSPPTVEAEDDSVFYSSFFESCEEREPLLRINR